MQTAKLAADVGLRAVGRGVRVVEERRVRGVLRRARSGESGDAITRGASGGWRSGEKVVLEFRQSVTLFARALHDHRLGRGGTVCVAGGAMIAPDRTLGRVTGDRLRRRELGPRANHTGA